MSRPTSLSAVTLVVADMGRSWAFYTALGFEASYGGADAPFTSLRVGTSYLNLQHTGEAPDIAWGRVIFHTDDVDGMYQRALTAGFSPDFPPRDAAWGERYFHLRDPDGHEVSFAKPL